MKKFVSIALSVVMAAGVFSIVPTSASAAGAKVSLKKSSATLKIEKKKGKTVYGCAKIRLKKSKGVSVKKITYKSADGKIAKVSKKGKVTACKKGDVKISVNVRYTFNKKSFNKKLTFKVKVKDTRKKAKKVNKHAVIVTPATEKQLATEATEPETVTETEAATVPEDTVPETTVTEAAVTETAAPSTEATEEKVEYTFYNDYPALTEPATSEDVWGDTSHCEITTPSYNPNPYPAGVETDPYGYTFATEETEPTTAVESETESAPMATAPATAVPAPVTFEERLSAFSNKLFAMTSAEVDDNYVFSPTSVYLALSLLHAIGDDNVKKDIEDFIGVDGSELSDTANLISKLEREYTDRRSISDDPKVVGEVKLSNSVWLDENVKPDVNEDTLKKLVDDYNCQIKEAPFKNDNQAANELVREFVKEQTKGVIDMDFGIPPETLFSLINTLYFKDIWNFENDLDTLDRVFHTDEGDKNCEFLEGYYFDGQVQSTEKCDYFYTTTANGYRFTFVVPKDGYTLEDVMTGDNLYQVNQDKEFDDYELVNETFTPEEFYNEYGEYADMYYDEIEKAYENVTEEGPIITIPIEYYYETRCVFPSFTIASSTPLLDVLTESGCLKSAVAAFNSPLLDTMPLRVDNIFQKAKIEVNKKGAEAAAVTIIDIAPGCCLEPITVHKYDTFYVDKGFCFLLTDNSGTILFEGKVVDPTI